MTGPASTVPEARAAGLRVGVVEDRPQHLGPFATGLRDALVALGVDVPAVSQLDRLPDVDAIVLVGVHCFDVAALEAVSDVTVVGVQTEQLTTAQQGAPTFGMRRMGRVLRVLPHCDVVLDWSAENARFLATRHPHVEWLPYGLIEVDRYARELEHVRPRFDLGFIGSLDAQDGRRRRLIESLGERFSVHPTSTAVWGVDKFRVMRECRILLNLHVEASKVFEPPRFFDVLGAERPLLSEPVYDPAPFRPGTDFIEAPVMQLAQAAQALLEDRGRRTSLAASGRARTVEFGMDATARELLRALHAARRVRDGAPRRSASPAGRRRLQAVRRAVRRRRGPARD